MLRILQKTRKRQLNQSNFLIKYRHLSLCHFFKYHANNGLCTKCLNKNNLLIITKFRNLFTLNKYLCYSTTCSRAIVRSAGIEVIK